MRTLKAETKRCEECTKNFEGHFNQKFCGVPCRRIYTKKINSSTRLIKEEDQVSCLICGIVFKGNLNSHLTIHDINTKEYLVQFPEAKLYSESYLKHCSDRITGNKNPAYDHGGRLSPFSDKFVGYKHLSDEETQARIQEVNIKRADTTDKNDNYTNRLSYYLKQGMSEDEANDALSERQTTFSLETCIEKYGQEEGLVRWNRRQDMWMGTMNSKSEEEVTRINRLKTSSSGCVSSAEKELYKFLHENQLMVESQFTIDSSIGYTYDLRYQNKIIEYNGTYWHCDPRKYKEDYQHTLVNKTAKEIWDKDKVKLNFAKNKGFDVLVIWESDFMVNKKEGMNKCLNFMIS